MSGNGGFILNWEKPETVTASNEKTGYEIENVFHPIPTFIFQSSSTSVNINMTYPEPTQITGFAIIRHNFTANTTATLNFYLNDGFNGPDLQIPVPYNETNTYIIMPDITAYKYVQLSIVSDLTIEIGCLYTGDYFQFPRNFSWGIQKKFEVTKSIVTTDAGIHFEETDSNTTPEWHSFKLNFTDVDGTHFNDYKRLILPGKKIFIKTCSKPVCYYGIVPDNKIEAKEKKSGDDYTINFYEDSLQGETQ